MCQRLLSCLFVLWQCVAVLLESRRQSPVLNVLWVRRRPARLHHHHHHHLTRMMMMISQVQAPNLKKKSHNQVYIHRCNLSEFKGYNAFSSFSIAASVSPACQVADRAWITTQWCSLTNLFSQIFELRKNRPQKLHSNYNYCSYLLYSWGTKYFITPAPGRSARWTHYMLGLPVRPSFHLFVRASIDKEDVLRANIPVLMHKWSTGQQCEMIDLWGQEVKGK